MGRVAVKPWVLDASAAISLLGSGMAVEFLKDLGPLELTIVRNTAAEVLTHPIDNSKSPLDVLEALGYLRIVEPSEETTILAVELITAPEPDDLGDGESFAIAHASIARGTVVLDDKKARRICSARFPQVSIADSIQLFRHPLQPLNPDRSRLALESALRTARMHVLEKDFDWVKALLGQDVDLFPSLRRLARTAKREVD